MKRSRSMVIQHSMPLDVLVLLFLITLLPSVCLPCEMKSIGSSQERLGGLHRMTLDIDNRVPISFCFVPAGTVWLGCPSGEYGHDPNDEVQNEYEPCDVGAFYMSEFEVTRRQFAYFVWDGGYEVEDYWGAANDKPRQRDPLSLGYRGCEEYPLEIVWQVADDCLDCPANYLRLDECMAFCRWLSVKTGLEVSLPTEAQWEYAAEGRTEEGEYKVVVWQKTGMTYAERNEIGPTDWGKANVGTIFEVYMADHPKDVPSVRLGEVPVGTFWLDKSWCGVYDLTGNALEWTLPMDVSATYVEGVTKGAWFGMGLDELYFEESSEDYLSACNHLRPSYREVWPSSSEVAGFRCVIQALGNQ